MAKILFALALLLAGCYPESKVDGTTDDTGAFETETGVDITNHGDDTSKTDDISDTAKVDDTAKSDTVDSGETDDTTIETGNSDDTATTNDTSDTVEDTDPDPIVDNDGDGYGEEEDCDDYDDLVNPGAVEYCDSLDNDCDGLIDNDAAGADTWYRDADGDGYGNAADSTESCDQPTGYVADNTDCRDSSRSVHPGATEVANGVDNDCDGEIDGDTSTEEPTDTAEPDPEPEEDTGTAAEPESDDTGVVADPEPTDDTDDIVTPEETDTEDTGTAAETECVTNADCGTSECYELFCGSDGFCYAGDEIDADGDGYGVDCGSASGRDCDDTDASLNPGAIETAGDLIDNDCDGTVDNGLEVVVDASVAAYDWSLCYASDSPYDWSHWYADTNSDGVLDDGNCIQITAGTDSVFVPVASGLVVQLQGDRSGGWLVESLGTVDYIDFIAYDGDELIHGADSSSDCWSYNNDWKCRVP